MDRTYRLGVIGDLATVRPFQHDLDGGSAQTCARQDRMERHARPLRRAHRAELPGHSFRFRLKKGPVVAGTFERRDNRLFGHAAQVVDAQFQLMNRSPCNLEAPRGGVELWRWEVVAHIKRFVGSKKGAERVKRE